MAIEHFFEDASRIMTVISFVTFAGILAWTYGLNRKHDFDEAAAMPFADNVADELEEDYV